jgi:hypothetical protein
MTGNAADEQLLGADIASHGLPRHDADAEPLRTIALMISTFSVSMTISASMCSRERSRRRCAA